MKITAEANTPAIMEKATISLDSRAPSTGAPNMNPATFSPISPPTSEPESKPTSTNRISPMPVPTYNPFFDVSILSIFRSSLNSGILIPLFFVFFHALNNDLFLRFLVRRAVGYHNIAMPALEGQQFLKSININDPLLHFHLFIA